MTVIVQAIINLMYKVNYNNIGSFYLELTIDIQNRPIREWMLAGKDHKTASLYRNPV